MFFSIDSINERFNYIRHPGDFDKTMENFWKFKSNDFLKVNIFYTVGLFNIMYMDDILKYDAEHNLNCEIHYNMVYAPEHVSPKALPPKVKQIITDKFKGHNDHRIQSTLNYMNNEQYNVKDTIPELVRQTKFSDTYRGESFAETFPELYVHLEEIFNERV